MAGCIFHLIHFFSFQIVKNSKNAKKYFLHCLVSQFPSSNYLQLTIDVPVCCLYVCDLHYLTLVLVREVVMVYTSCRRRRHPSLLPSRFGNMKEKIYSLLSTAFLYCFYIHSITNLYCTVLYCTVHSIANPSTQSIFQLPEMLGGSFMNLFGLD